MVGKDIVRFHTIYWPALLMAAGLQPPRRVFAHGWWTNEGQKMSKSLGNALEPHAMVAKYGLDQVRYFLLREIPFGNDGDFSHRAMVQRINSDLANGLGNLAQRVLSMINKNCAGQVPQPGAFTDADKTLLASAHGLVAKLRPLMVEQAFNRALEAIWQVVGEGDRYIDEQKPWTLKKTDPARMATVLYVLAETVRHLAILVQPFTPHSMAKMLDQLAAPAGVRNFATLGEGGALKPGTPLPAPEGVFPRYVEEAAR
jgi:methionyl-tRNA synthetase